MAAEVWWCCVLSCLLSLQASGATPVLRCWVRLLHAPGAWFAHQCRAGCCAPMWLVVVDGVVGIPQQAAWVWCVGTAAWLPMAASCHCLQGGEVCTRRFAAPCLLRRRLWPLTPFSTHTPHTQCPAMSCVDSMQAQALYQKRNMYMQCSHSLCRVCRC